jgi:hypothetical protein
MWHPFEDEELIEDIKKERNELIKQLERYNMPDSERRFLVRKIENITNKLLEKAKYAKKV